MLHTLFGFRGRIGRGSWWLAQLIAIPVVYILGFGMLVGMVGFDPEADVPADPPSGALFLVIILAIAVSVWINLASTIKRYHDRDKSGLWFLVILVPFIGGIWQLIECGFCTGDDSDNTYGPPGGSGGGFADKPNGKLAKLDEDYFRDYATQTAAPPVRASEPIVKSTYARPAATVSSGASGARPVFGRR